MPVRGSSSSRTLVTNFAGFGRYRFFAERVRECGDAWRPLCPERLSERLPKAEELIVATAVRSGVNPGGFVEFAGGYAAERVEDAERRRLLLPLREDQRAGELRENVRAAEVCVAMVGGHL